MARLSLFMIGVGGAIGAALAIAGAPGPACAVGAVLFAGLAGCMLEFRW